MTIKVICEDGAKFEGNSYEEIVKAMAQVAWMNEGEDTKDYMAQVAKRCRVYNPKHCIDYSDAQTFLEELQRVGVVTIIKERRG